MLYYVGLKKKGGIGDYTKHYEKFQENRTNYNGCDLDMHKLSYGGKSRQFQSRYARR